MREGFPRAVSFLLSSGLRTRSWQLISIPHFFLNAVNFPQTNTNDESGWTIQRNLPKSRSHTTVGIIIMLGSEIIDGWIFISLFFSIYFPSVNWSKHLPSKEKVIQILSFFILNSLGFGSHLLWRITYYLPHSKGNCMPRRNRNN